MFTIYQAEGACATFAGLCLQMGDWATWAASVATFLAVVVALAVALRETWHRRTERQRTSEIYLELFESDTNRASKMLERVTRRIESVLHAGVGGEVDTNVLHSLADMESKATFPTIEAHVTQLIHIPKAQGDALAYFLGRLPYLRYHIRLVADATRSVGYSELEIEAANRVKLAVDKLSEKLRIFE